MHLQTGGITAAVRARHTSGFPCCFTLVEPLFLIAGSVPGSMKAMVVVESNQLIAISPQLTLPSLLSLPDGRVSSASFHLNYAHVSPLVHDQVKEGKPSLAMCALIDRHLLLLQHRSER